ncbi:hypothetical protein P7C73_g5907, partial [Tremellales sp. Uapishka_1]
MDVPDMASLSISPTISLANPSPALTHASTTSISTEPHRLNLDLSLSTALHQLLLHLVTPLSAFYPSITLQSLRTNLYTALEAKFSETWNEAHPPYGSGCRSLICTTALGLPPVLRRAARQAGVDESVWRGALAGGERREKDEWEVWCDPGTVVCRMGGWEWEDIGFELGKVHKEPFQVIWQASSQPASTSTEPSQIKITPARPSHAVPIRAPTVFQIPPTPLSSTQISTMDEPSLLPAAIIDFPRSPSPSSSEDDDARGHSSMSSITSSLSENSGRTQLLTPASRPASTDPFAVPFLPMKLSKTPISRGRTPSPADGSATPSSTGGTVVPTPSVTPYDGGNVTVLGGGVKLGGASRPSSIMSTSRAPHDRTRSPSVSLAGRALNSALGPGTPPSSPRKQRTRRRIMPTYLGHVGQPGIGPVMGVFQYPSGKQWNVQPGGGMAGGLGMRPMTLGMQRMV